jgi:hypothetical protein
MGVVRLSRRLIEVSVLLGSGAVSLGVWCRKFRGKIVVSPSRVEFLTIKNETTMLSRNIGHF